MHNPSFIDTLFTTLREEGLPFGLDQRLKVEHLILSGYVDSPDSLRRTLGRFLCKSPADWRKFNRVYDSLRPERGKYADIPDTFIDEPVIEKEAVISMFLALLLTVIMLSLVFVSYSKLDRAAYVTLSQEETETEKEKPHDSKVQDREKAIQSLLNRPAGGYEQQIAPQESGDLKAEFYESYVRTVKVQGDPKEREERMRLRSLVFSSLFIITFLITAGVVFFFFYRGYKRGRFKPPSFYRLNIRSDRTPLPFRHETITDLADTLQLRGDVEGKVELDIVKTIDANARGGGMAKPLFKEEKISYSLLILIDMSDPLAPWVERVDFLASEMKRYGIHIESLFYPGFGDIFYSERQLRGREVIVDTLLEEYESHRVMVFGTEGAMFQPWDGKEFPWIGAIRSFDHKVWLNPYPKRNWSKRSLMISETIPMFPFDERGLIESAASFVNQKEERFHSVTERSAPPSSIKELFGDSYPLLCASCLVDEVSYPLFQLLRDELFPEGEINSFHLFHFIQGVRRSGPCHYELPPQLRERLISDLDRYYPDRADKARKIILGLLKEDRRQVDINSGLYIKKSAQEVKLSLDLGEVTKEEAWKKFRYTPMWEEFRSPSAIKWWKALLTALSVALIAASVITFHYITKPGVLEITTTPVNGEVYLIENKGYETSEEGFWNKSNLHGSMETITQLIISPGGKSAVIGYSDGYIEVLNLLKESVVKTFQAHREAISLLRFTPQGERFLSASSGGELKLWPMEEEKVLWTLTPDGGPVTSIALSNSANSIAAALQDYTIRLWSLSTGEELKQLKAHKAPIHALSFSPDGKTVASGSHNGALILWEPVTGKPLETIQQSGSPVRDILIPSHNQFMMIADSGSSIIVWDMLSKSVKGRVGALIDGPQRIAMSSDNMHISYTGHRKGKGDFVILADTYSGMERIEVQWQRAVRIPSITFTEERGVLIPILYEEGLSLWRIELFDKREKYGNAPMAIDVEPKSYLFEVSGGYKYKPVLVEVTIEEGDRIKRTFQLEARENGSDHRPLPIE